MYYRFERNSKGYTHVFGDDLVNEMYANDVPCLELAENNMAVTKPEVVVTYGCAAAAAWPVRSCGRPHPGWLALSCHTITLSN